MSLQIFRWCFVLFKLSHRKDRTFCLCFPQGAQSEFVRARGAPFWGLDTFLVAGGSPNPCSNINSWGFTNLMGEREFASTQVQAVVLHVLMCRGSRQPFFLRGSSMACSTSSLFFFSVFLKTLLIKWISQGDARKGS